MIIMFAFVGIASNAQSFGEKIQYGVLIIDGKSYIANDKFFRQFYNHANSLNATQRFYLTGIKNALMNGETVIYNSLIHELSPNVKFAGLNARQERRLNRDRSKIGMWFDAIFNSKIHNIALAISSLQSFDPY